MGCDIHCFIEYKKGDRWNSFGDCINPGRDYAMFSKLAGVRNYDEVKPISDPRGFPRDASYRANDSFTIYVDDKNKDNCERWVKEGSSVVYQKDPEGKPQRVTSPDWHSCSWLTTEEWFSVIALERIVERRAGPEYYAIHAAMKSFEEQGFPARVIFWFDN